MVVPSRTSRKGGKLLAIWHRAKNRDWATDCILNSVSDDNTTSRGNLLHLPWFGPRLRSLGFLSRMTTLLSAENASNSPGGFLGFAPRDSAGYCKLKQTYRDSGTTLFRSETLSSEADADWKIRSAATCPRSKARRRLSSICLGSQPQRRTGSNASFLDAAQASF
jgi:hypothetical protein